jgi:hypothetical protein
MAKPVFDSKEPAHPWDIRAFSDLVKIYSAIRQFQGPIDQAFDKASSLIGYVVTTTLPLALEVGARGRVKSAALAGDHLKDTVWTTAFAEVMSTLAKEMTIPSGQSGDYSVALIWFEALKLKFRADWCEPAHWRGAPPIDVEQPSRPRVAHTTATAVQRVAWEIREPAHVFRGVLLDDRVAIAALDEVYPELQLMQRCAMLQGSRGAFEA